MFKAANKGIKKITQQKQKVIKQLESLLAGCVNVYKLETVILKYQSYFVGIKQIKVKRTVHF